MRVDWITSGWINRRWLYLNVLQFNEIMRWLQTNGFGENPWKYLAKYFNNHSFV